MSPRRPAAALARAPAHASVPPLAAARPLETRPPTRKGEAARARLVSKTGELLARQGFHATGLAQIVAESGSPRGSLYFYFPGGKEELACAALAEAGAAWRTQLEAVVDAAPDPATALTAVCGVLASSLEHSGWRDGCPLATVALEAASSSEPVRAIIASHYAGWEALIAERLVALGVSAREATALATFTLATIEGAMLLSKVKRDTAPLLQAAELLAAMSRAAHAPAAAPKTRKKR